MDNYLIINGRRIALTEEQVKQLTRPEKKSPFNRKKMYDEYYCVDSLGTVCKDIELGEKYNRTQFDVANYCTDRALMEQRALRETLDRLLWRFACENGELENPWDGRSEHWSVFFDTEVGKFESSFVYCIKSGTNYFPSRAIAQRAIDEIIVPFMAAHPDFVW